MKLAVLFAMVVASAVVLVTVMSPVAFSTEGYEVRPVKRGKFGYVP